MPSAVMVASCRSGDVAARCRAAAAKDLGDQALPLLPGDRRELGGEHQVVGTRRGDVGHARISPIMVLNPVLMVPNPIFGVQGRRQLSNFFGRRVSAYQVGVTDDVSFDDDF